MIKTLLFMAAIFLALPALAENPPSAPAAAGTPLVYELRDLRPAGIIQYAGVGDVVRQYFQFHDAQSSHSVIYEEAPTAPAARGIMSLRQASTSYDSQCSLDIECSSKAFCTGDCKQMFYEVSNAPGDSLSPDRNKCKVLFFSCEKAGSV
ncbi:MAG TPA: hypothetical protein VIH99_10150, partial [Bdellovibrionota bacterium]